MKKILYLFAFVMLFSCQPRVEMDMNQWGDHAYIDNVEVVKLDIIDSVKLAEYYQNQTPISVTGVRNIVISQGRSQIDSLDFTATVSIKPGEDLKYTALKIYHKGSLVKPTGNTPKAGIITDLSQKEFTYCIESADGSKHDWIIKLK